MATIRARSLHSVILTNMSLCFDAKKTPSQHTLHFLSPKVPSVCALQSLGFVVVVVVVVVVYYSGLRDTADSINYRRFPPEATALCYLTAKRIRCREAPPEEGYPDSRTSPTSAATSLETYCLLYASVTIPRLSIISTLKTGQSLVLP